MILYWVERRARHPILPIDLLSNQPFLMVCVQRFLAVFPLYVILFSFSIYAQKFLGLSAISAGGFLLSMTLSIAILSPLCGKLSDWIGPKKNLLFSLITYIVWSVMLLLFLLKAHAYWLGLSLVLPGLAYALSSPAALALTIQVVPKDLHGAANGLFYMLSVFSGLLAVAFSAAVMHSGHSSFDNMLIIALMMLFMCVVGLVLMFFWLIRPNGRYEKTYDDTI